MVGVDKYAMEAVAKPHIRDALGLQYCPDSERPNQPWAGIDGRFKQAADEAKADQERCGEAPVSDDAHGKLAVRAWFGEELVAWGSADVVW